MLASLSVCHGQTSWDLYRSGDYEAAIAEAKTAIDDTFSVSENWFLLKARSELAIGRHVDALQTIVAGLERYSTSVRIRNLGIQAARMNNRPKLARDYLSEIDEYWSRSAWRYRSPQNQIAVAEALLLQRHDAKQVLKKILTPARDNNPDLPEIHLAIGRLALLKHDTPFAAESFTKAAQLQPNDPDAQFGLAMAFRGSNSKRATDALSKALELNPNHVPSRLLQIDQYINQEAYDQAESAILNVLKINPHQPDAWAYRAAVANLRNKPKLEGEYRNRALALWQDNPHIDFLIGQKLSQKYRFAESLKYQRRALVYDSKYLPAKLQLAHDLLRVGDELEGWKVADEVFDEDPYSVVAFNLVTLRDNLTKFDTIESDGFVVRMSKSESAIYGQHVMDILRDAKKTLTEKYEVELQTPIFIEIFPKQSDFAIRTFGLPGGAGFLGVCFGRVVTMNSPAAQGPQLTNWKSVLWHEFCHVVTLQKTRNRMPRWLSEGISVYEERKKNAAWGQSMNPRYREMLLGDDLTPISQLSQSFLNPKSAAHLDLAYFTSSLAVEFIIDKHGLDILKQVLDELAIGIPVNDSLRRHVAPLPVLDQKFTQFVKDRCNSFAKDVDFRPLETDTVQSVQQWKQLAEDHPTSRLALTGLATAQTKAGEFDESNLTLQRLLEIYPMTDGAAPAFMLMARNYRELDQTDRELETLEQLVSISASDTAACLRILELCKQKSDWTRTRQYAEQLMGINPLIKSPHRYLADAAENLQDDPSLVKALNSLTHMDPLDPADTHFRLARSLHRQNQNQLAKRHALMALEFAPRYQDAHRLLMEIIESDSASDVNTVEAPLKEGENSK